jgi:hypothetical protein
VCSILADRALLGETFPQLRGLSTAFEFPLTGTSRQQHAQRARGVRRRPLGRDGKHECSGLRAVALRMLAGITEADRSAALRILRSRSAPCAKGIARGATVS